MEIPAYIVHSGRTPVCVTNRLRLSLQEAARKGGLHEHAPRIGGVFADGDDSLGCIQLSGDL